MTYFDLDHQTTREELAVRYRELAKEHHPDFGGDVSVMQDINGEYKEALRLLSERLLPALIPKEKPTKATRTQKIKTDHIKRPPQKKRAPAKQKAVPKRETRRGKTIVDILADVAIFGVEQLRERLREK